MQDLSLDANIRYIAAIVLKNTLRNHIVTLAQVSPQELQFVKAKLLEVLLQLPGMAGVPEFPRKIIKQIIFILTRVVVQEFMSMDEESTFLQNIIVHFS